MSTPAFAHFLVTVFLGEGRRKHLAERRSLARYPIKSKANVTWLSGQDQGRCLAARGVNMSEGGAMIRAGDPIEPGSAVWLDFADLRLNGGARVAHCTKGTFRYSIGLRFSGPLFRSLRGVI